MPPWDKLVLLTIAMVGVRSFAMGINRIFDLPFDRENPRTANRHLVTGEISVRQAWIFLLVMAAIFVLACAAINTVCLILSVPALLFCRRLQPDQAFLGRLPLLAGATLPGAAGRALAVNPEATAMGPIMLFFAVTFWVGAFDIYYSFQDYDFDVAFRLCSVPSVYGPDTALVPSPVFFPCRHVHLPVPDRYRRRAGLALVRALGRCVRHPVLGTSSDASAGPQPREHGLLHPQRHHLAAGGWWASSWEWCSKMPRKKQYQWDVETNGQEAPEQLSRSAKSARARPCRIWAPS